MSSKSRKLPIRFSETRYSNIREKYSVRETLIVLLEKFGVTTPSTTAVRPFNDSTVERSVSITAAANEKKKHRKHLERPSRRVTNGFKRICSRSVVNFYFFESNDSLWRVPKRNALRVRGNAGHSLTRD